MDGKREIQSKLDNLSRKIAQRRQALIQREQAWLNSNTQSALGALLLESRVEQAQGTGELARVVSAKIEEVRTMLLALPNSPSITDEEETLRLPAIRVVTPGTGPIVQYERSRPRQVETELDTRLLLQEAVIRRINDYCQTFGHLPGKIILSSLNAFYLTSTYPGSFFVYRDQFRIPVADYHRLPENHIILCPEK